MIELALSFQKYLERRCKSNHVYPTRKESFSSSRPFFKSAVKSLFSPKQYLETNQILTTKRPLVSKRYAKNRRFERIHMPYSISFLRRFFNAKNKK